MMLVVCLCVAILGLGRSMTYPDDMPENPFDVQDSLRKYGCLLSVPLLETPILARIVLASAWCNWNCVAFYDDKAFDGITHQRPIIDTPQNMHTTENRILCNPYCWALLGTTTTPSPAFVNPLQEGLTQLFQSWGLTDPLPSFSLDEDLLQCDIDDADCIDTYAANYGYEPYAIAQIIAYGIFDEYQDDGWNQDGSLANDGLTCSENCQPFSDYSSYFPANLDYDLSSYRYDSNCRSDSSNKNRKRSRRENRNENDQTKCCLKGNQKRWQPLLETDTNGFFFRQQHVVPFIGSNAKRYFTDKIPLVNEPNYNYELESQLVIERLNDLSFNNTRKLMIEWFDNKCLARSHVQLNYKLQFKDKMSYELYTYYLLGLSYAESEAILHAWYNKRYYDLVRPTTVIQGCYFDDNIDIWVANKGLQSIKGAFFQPYIRTMPHSEYPSGSSCLCQTYADFSSEFVEKEFEQNPLFSFPLSLTIEKDSSKIETNLPNDDTILNFNNVYEYANLCGESRLWGGMHFTQSVPAGKEACNQIGKNAYQFVKDLKQDSDFNGAYFED